MIKKFIREKIIEPVSISAVRVVANSSAELRKVWEYSFEIFPDFGQHYSIPVDNKEVEQRIRLLVAAETVFVRKAIENVIEANGRCSYADVGDSDGSVRLLLNKYSYGDKLSHVGINLQKNAVEKIRSKGLDAICADALSLGDQGASYDIVSAFETLEHLSDPIGFLQDIRKVTNNRLILSVPFIRKSRLGLAYTSNKWPKDKAPSIENTHIFELSSLDWKKIFLHSGWKVENEWKLIMFPLNRLSRLILQPFWRFVSFEGFWFVSLYKDSEFSSQYRVE